MTKGGVTMGEKQYPPSTPPPVYVQIPAGPENGLGYHQRVNTQASSSMYVLSILATFFCIPICGLIGLIHAMIAQHEGERGNVEGHQRRLRQAKCWTGWSIGVGLFILCAMLIYAIAVTCGYSYTDAWDWCGTTFLEWGDYNSTGNYTEYYNYNYTTDIIF